MHFALTALLSVLAPAQEPTPNLAFRSGNLSGWRGFGFYVTTADCRGPSIRMGVCSSDRGTPGRLAKLRTSFIVPAGAVVLSCYAYAACKKGLSPDDRLDVLLLTDEGEVLPKSVKRGTKWMAADGLLPPAEGRPHEYRWDLADLAGRRVQIVLVDDDARPGCHLFCSGFRLASAGGGQGSDFARQMGALVRAHGLGPATRFESRHFVAWSNADKAFTRGRLRNCELMYQLFFEHFRRRGFAARAPASKLMVAVFDSHAGFQAYLGQPMPLAVTGVYHRAFNQLAIYDLNQNPGLLAQRDRGLQTSRSIRNDRNKLHYLETLHRHISEWSKDGSLSTAMHETAHQLSFNSGLLNRNGDVAAWLSEGLACYCEATDQGSWQGIGEFNPGRASVLATIGQRGGPFIPLRYLIEQDEWRWDGDRALLGYSQSWALFRLLVQQQPAALRRYLELIYPRQASDHRLTDFGEVFGPDLGALERRYTEYLRQLAARAPVARH